MKKFKKEWKPIYLFGKETQYRVSNYGDILDTNNEKLRTHYISKKTRYHMVRLKIDDEWMNFSVSRLVATAFLANPFNYEEVDHLNCDKINILLESGTSPKDIIEILSLPNNKKTISMIYGRKYHIVQK